MFLKYKNKKLKLREKLSVDLKTFIVNVGWTHKIHIIEADRLSKCANMLATIKIITSALTASGLIAIVFGEGSFIFNLIIAILSFITLFLNGLDKMLNLNKNAIKEYEFANDIWYLREESKKLLSEVIYGTENIEKINFQYNKLYKERTILYKNISFVSEKSVIKATKLIKRRKDNCYEDDYEFFIPKNLRELKEDLY